MIRYYATLKERIAEIASKLPKDAFLDGCLSSTALIQKSMEEDECIFFIVYGSVRYGKTAYAMKTLAQIKQTWDWEVLKDSIIYKPTEFISKVRFMRKLGKQPLLIWEDAGVWLDRMKWSDPLVSALAKYFDVAGTDFGAIMFTTPLPQHVIKRVRGLPDCITVKVTKLSDRPDKPRLASGYRMWMLPDLKKTRVQPIFTDTFSALMPNVFYKPYLRYRKSYANETFKEIRDVLSLGQFEGGQDQNEQN